MSMREKDQADFDLETFVDLFDTAMSSDNPAVQRALKNLILISAMVNAQQNLEGLRKGPLRRVVDDINNITRRLNQLESAGAYRSTYVPTTITSPGTAAPSIGPWSNPTYSPGTVLPTTTWPNTISPQHIPPGTIVSESSTSNTYKAQAMTQIDVNVGSLLDKLEVK